MKVCWSIYVQSFLGLAALLPSNVDMARSLLVSSTVTIVSLDIATIIFHFQPESQMSSFHYLIVLVLNAILLAPVLVTTVRNFIPCPENTFSTKSDLIFILISGLLIAVNSVFLSYSSFWYVDMYSFSRESINDLADECPDYITTTGTLLAISLTEIYLFLLITFSLMITAGKYPHVGGKALDVSFGKIFSIGVYSLLLIEITYLEGFRSEFGPQTSNQPNWGFGQIFALAIMVAPIFELIRYFFRRMSFLSGVSPAAYLCNVTNINRRKIP